MIRAVVADVHVRPDNGFANPAVRAGTAAMCPGVGDWAVDEQVAELARLLSKRVGALVTAIADQITAEVSFYREQRTVSPAERRCSCRAHLEYVFGSLGTPVSRGISAAQHNRRRRADADVPLPALMDAYRVGTRFIWECLWPR